MATQDNSSDRHTAAANRAADGAPDPQQPATPTAPTRRPATTAGHGAPAGQWHDVWGLVVDPQALSDAADRISHARVRLRRDAVDPDLLRDDVIGHPGLAQALREFTDVYNQRLAELDDELDFSGHVLRQVAGAYQTTTESTARSLTELDPTSRAVPELPPGSSPGAQQ